MTLLKQKQSRTQKNESVAELQVVGLLSGRRGVAIDQINAYFFGKCPKNICLIDPKYWNIY